jgi:hypothetical protein
MYRWDYDEATSMGISKMCKNPPAEYNRRMAALQRLENTKAIAAATANTTTSNSKKSKK